MHTDRNFLKYSSRKEQALPLVARAHLWLTSVPVVTMGVRAGTCVLGIILSITAYGVCPQLFFWVVVVIS